MKYTKEEIVRAIKKWQKVVESMGDKVEDVKDKIKEGAETVSDAASIAKSAAIIVSKMPEALKLAKELADAINRGAAAVEKLNASRDAQ